MESFPSPERRSSLPSQGSDRPFRLPKRQFRQQIALLVGMALGGVLGVGCQSASKPHPAPSDRSPVRQKPTESTKPQTNVRRHAYLERTDIDPRHINLLSDTPIVLTPYTSDVSVFISNNGSEIDWSPSLTEDRPARRFAVLDRELDIEGDLELSLYHWRETHEWPDPLSGPPSPKLLREGRLALGDWLMDHTRNSVIMVLDNPEVQALRPRFFWKRNEGLEEDIDLDLTFNLSQDPREKPLPLARLRDNANQLLAFILEQSTPENRFARTLVRPALLFLIHMIDRIEAHVTHELGHARDEEIDAHLQGYRAVNGIPLPAFFPRITFEDANGNIEKALLEDYWRDRFLASIAAGPNQLTLSNRLIYLRNLRQNGPMNIVDSWSWLAQNSLMPGSAPLGYMLSDRNLYGKQGNNPGDINQYIALMREKGIDMNVDTMIRNNLIALLSSADSYRALSTVVNEVIDLINTVTGLEIGHIPDIPGGVEVLGARFHWPLVQHFLTPDGEIMQVTVPINQGRQNPIMLDLSFDLDNTQSGAQVNTLRGGMTVGHHTKWFEVEAGGYLSTRRDELKHFRAVTGVGRLTIPVPETPASFTIQLTHQYSFDGQTEPIARIYGIDDGTTCNVLFNLRW